MKNFKKFTAFVLALCMLFSLSVAAFAADADERTIYDSAPDEEPVVSSEAATSGTIQNSGIRWSLDEKGWLPQGHYWMKMRTPRKSCPCWMWPPP